MPNLLSGGRSMTIVWATLRIRWSITTAELMRKKYPLDGKSHQQNSALEAKSLREFGNRSPSRYERTMIEAVKFAGFTTSVTKTAYVLARAARRSAI
jgi:hypothetical protein